MCQAKRPATLVFAETTAKIQTITAAQDGVYSLKAERTGPMRSALLSMLQIPEFSHVICKPTTHRRKGSTLVVPPQLFRLGTCHRVWHGSQTACLCCMAAHFGRSIHGEIPTSVRHRMTMHSAATCLMGLTPACVQSENDKPKILAATSRFHARICNRQQLLQTAQQRG